MVYTDYFVVYDKVIDQFALGSIRIGKISWDLEKNISSFLEELN
jgi:hypothetical protein